MLALGNSLRGDEGAPHAVLDALRGHVTPSDGLELSGSISGGIALLSMVTGFDRVLIIDSDQTQGRSPGDVHTHTPETMEETMHAASDSGGIQRVLELGERFYPGQMPKEVVTVAIEVGDCDSFKEGLSPAVEAAVPVAAEAALAVLRGWGVPAARRARAPQAFLPTSPPPRPREG